MNRPDQEERNQKENDEFNFGNFYLKYKEHRSGLQRGKSKLFFNIPTLISVAYKGKIRVNKTTNI